MIFTGKNKIIGFKQNVKTKTQAETYFGLLDKLLSLIWTNLENTFQTPWIVMEKLWYFGRNLLNQTKVDNTHNINQKMQKKTKLQLYDRNYFHCR